MNLGALLAVLSVLSALGWGANLISDGISNLGGGGSQTINYTEGREAIVSARFDLPEELSKGVTQVSVSGWTLNREGNRLDLSGGTLSPGQSLILNYKVNKYIDPGQTEFPAIYTTASGQTISSTSAYSAGQSTYIYWALEFLHKNAIWFTAALIPTLLFWQRNGLLSHLRKVPTVSTNNLESAADELPNLTDQPAENQAQDSPDEDDKKDDKKPTAYGIDITKCPGDWFPEGTNSIEFTARTYDCKEGHWVFPGKPAQITLELHNVSTEKGVCLNYGENGNTPDLFFEEHNPLLSYDDASEASTYCPEFILGVPNRSTHKQHYQKVKSKIPVSELKVKVRCEDFGAWGWIEASADDHLQIPPRESLSPLANCPDGTCFGYKPPEVSLPKSVIPPYWVKIPVDSNNNNIPDCLPLYDSCGSGEKAARQDNDAAPTGNGTDGDGLTVYEEYRGFMVNEGEIIRGKDPKRALVHKRTDPGRNG